MTSRTTRTDMDYGRVGKPPRAEHTPGPWLIHATNRLIVQADGAFAELTVKDGKVEGDDLPTTICLLRNPSDTFSEDETLANGFLIAAAPSLYEALRQCLAIINCHCKPDVCCTLSDGGDVFSATDAHNAAVAAINKARGEVA